MHAQLSGETHACALGDVYTFGPTFRAENSQTARHLAEFWMIEPEMSFANLKDDMDNAARTTVVLFFSFAPAFCLRRQHVVSRVGATRTIDTRLRVLFGFYSMVVRSGYVVLIASLCWVVLMI